MTLRETYIHAKELPATVMRVRSWDDLVSEFGLDDDGQIKGVNIEGDLSCLDRDQYDAYCHVDLHFQEGSLESDEAVFYRWECEESFEDNGVFELSDDIELLSLLS